MAQQPVRFCSECGALLQAGQRFCTNCGATMQASAGAETAATVLAGDPTVASDLPAGGFGAGAPPRLSTLPPQMEQPSAPPPPPPGASAYNPYTASTPGVQTYPNTGAPVYHPTSAPGFAPVAPGGTPAPVPAYARKPKGGRSCLITSLILLVVLVGGIVGFLFLRSRSGLSVQHNGAATTPGSTATSGGGETPTVGTSGLQPLNLKITYASMAITIVSAQIAASFPDDSSGPGSAGVLRVNLQENNATAGNPGYLESDAILLVMPDGSTVRMTGEKQNISPDAGVNRPNWLDFALNSQVNVGQLVLRMGAASENQMDIPLKSGVDLSKYQDKVSSPGAQFVYAAVNWTLKSATLSYNYNDRQATTGNLYVILSLSAINNSANSFVDSASTFLRLQANGNSAEPDGHTTLPIVINAHTTASGVVAFLMPQGTTAFTLVLLDQPNSNPPINQVTQNFQIQ
jgi:hypothetical protein